jgi:hypothetical protein
MLLPLSKHPVPEQATHAEEQQRIAQKFKPAEQV